MRNWIIVIRETAEALKVSVRPTDIVARFDLDNFYILIEDVMNKDLPLLVASRIYSTLNEKLAGLGKKVQFPIWIGILLCDSGYENIDEILRDTRTARSLRKPQEAALEYFDRASIGDQLCEDRT